MNLFIDTASSRILLSLIQDGTVLARIDEENDHQLSARIFPLIDQLFTKVNKKPSDVDRIYVVNGPGSFTGVRIGVTIAKTMAWTLKKEIVPVSELELMATSNSNTSYLVPMIDARRNAVFAAIYDKDSNVVLKEQYIAIDDLMKQIPNKEDVTYFSYTELPVECETKVPDVNIVEMIKRHQNDIPQNPHQVNPNYLKRTEAEENLEKKLHD